MPQLPYGLADVYCEIRNGRTDESALLDACNAIAARGKGLREIVSVVPLPATDVPGYVRYGILIRNLPE